MKKRKIDYFLQFFYSSLKIKIKVSGVYEAHKADKKWGRSTFFISFVNDPFRYFYSILQKH